MTYAPKRIAIAIVEHDNRFLVGRRPEGVALAGYHEFPGGKIEADESPAEAAVRECHEETGLTVRVIEQLAPVTHHYDYGPVELHFFKCAPAEPATAPREPYQWIAREALKDLRWPAANVAIIAELTR